MRILLLSAYHAQSHARWCDGLMQHMAQHEWTLLTLPPRYFSWRMRGNALSFAFEQGALLREPYDLVLATSMTDIAGLKGLVPTLARIPWCLYFHENQFEYPAGKSTHSPLDLQMVTLLNIAAADGIAFNSEWNKRSLMDGAKSLLEKLPDHVPQRQLTEKLTRAKLLPVPLAGASNLARAASGDRLHVLWNHRWEHDKNPELLLEILAASSELLLRVSVVGQQFRRQPKAFTKTLALLDADNGLDRGRWGFVSDEQEYADLLRSADIVLSTANHDFQGLAVMEAVQAGCVPLLPDRLCYPDFFDQTYLYSDNAAEKLRNWSNNGLPDVPSLTHLTWSKLRGQYEDWLQSVV